jgi:hypothetical protein
VHLQNADASTLRHLPSLQQRLGVADAGALPASQATARQADAAQPHAPLPALHPGVWMRGLNQTAAQQGVPRNPARAGAEADDAVHALHDDDPARDDGQDPEHGQEHGMPDAAADEPRPARRLPTYAGVTAALRRAARGEALQRLAQGRCVLVLCLAGRPSRGVRTPLTACLLCPPSAQAADGRPDGAVPPQGTLKAFRGWIDGALSDWPTLGVQGGWRVRQHSVDGAWGLHGDAATPAWWLDADPAAASGRGIHLVDARRMRLELARQWVLWVTWLVGEETDV